MVNIKARQAVSNDRQTINDQKEALFEVPSFRLSEESSHPPGAIFSQVKGSNP